MEPRRRFRFLKQLSEGTFGRVYMAEMVTDNNFSSVVAIKLLHGKWLGHEEVVQRSRDEARVLGLLHHRNIIRVEDLTSINNQCAVIMEYLDGIDLKSLINHCAEFDQRIPFKVIFEVMSATASALEAAYYREPLRGGSPLNLIHRDIKPSNIMLTREGDIKVLDFGTAQARFEDREAETQALAFGSQAYMAPERLLGDPDAPSGDVFSLGMTLYELLALESFGKVHIRPEQYDETIRERLDALDFGTLDAQLAGQIRDILDRLLLYDASHRPNAREVLELMEDLSDQVYDASLRRFCREVVAQIQARSPLPDNPDDPLAGSTLFEDVTDFADDEGSLNASPTMAFEPPDGPPDPGAAPPAESTAELPRPEDEPAEPAPPLAEPPLPKQTIQKTVTPTAVPAPTPTPAPEPTPSSGSGGRWAALALAAVVSLLVLAAGGAYVASTWLGESGTPEPVADEAPEPAVPEGIPGQRLIYGEGTVDPGTIILKLEGARASVKIDATTSDFEEVWDGSGALEVVGLPAGVYKTRIKSAGGTVRTTVESVPEQICTYTFTVGGGGEEWNRDCQ